MKAKIRSKKILSLLLAVIMLLGMIPTATIGIFATDTDTNDNGVTDTLEAKIADYDNTETFTIYSVADWNAVAAATKDFVGKKVELGATIEGTSDQLATLSSLNANFGGEFDGNGYSLTYVTQNGRGLLGTGSAGDSVYIHDVKIQNSSFVASNYPSSLFLGWTNVPTTYENITVRNTTYDAVGKESTGLLLGRHQGAETENALTISNVTITGVTIDRAQLRHAFLVGDLYLSGNVTVTGVNITNSSFIGNSNRMRQSGGFFGIIRNGTGGSLLVRNSSIDASTTFTATATHASAYGHGLGIGTIMSLGGASTVTFQNCSFAGTFNANTMYLGGVIGNIQGGANTLDVQIIGTTMNANLAMTGTAGTTSIAVGGAVGAITPGTNVTLTIAGSTIGGTITPKSHPCGAIVGTATGVAEGAISVKNSVITTKDGEEAVDLAGAEVSITTTTDATMKGGYLQYTENGYTATPAENISYSAYAIRFIALAQNDTLANAGMTIIVKDANGTIVKVFDTTECEIADKLYGYNDLGEYTENNVSDYNAEKFLAVIIEDIPTGVAYSYEVIPHYTSADGSVAYGAPTVAQFDANGTLTNEVN